VTSRNCSPCLVAEQIGIGSRNTCIGSMGNSLRQTKSKRGSSWTRSHEHRSMFPRELWARRSPQPDILPRCGCGRSVMIALYEGALATITRGVRRLFGNHLPIPGPKSRRLATQLSGPRDSNFLWCLCGRPLAPIVLPLDRASLEIEVIALACPKGHGSVPVAGGLLCEGIDR
jgi:hypothetical protein